MDKRTRNGIITALCLVILGSLGLTAYAIWHGRSEAVINPNVTLVTAPDQEGFEEHLDWTIPATEPIDYGENLALGKDVKQNGQTQIYNGKNVTDGDRFTYWEGAADSYPNSLTIDLEAAVEVTGARILLNPRQIWGARTQEVAVLVSTDAETFITVVDVTILSFDPLEDNSVYIGFPETVTARYVQFQFYSNSGATAGQAAEIEVYGK